MRITTRILIAFLVVVSLSSCAPKEEPELVVYTYDSFTAEWGAGPKIAPLFEKATGIKVKFVAKGDGGQILADLLMEKDQPRADLALGLDNQLAPRVLEADLLVPYRPRSLDTVPSELRFDPTDRLQPFDYGHFAIIWDSKALPDPPRSLEDLTKPEYAKKLIIMDPRTSTPGLGFLAWTKEVYGTAWEAYWSRLKPSILTMTPGWDTGYGLFTSGEAPLVLSYTTSPAYHAEYDEVKNRYQALEFSEGHPLQIEAAGIVKGAQHRKNAERFMDFLLSPECQAELPLTQWMYPARKDVPLPASYASALKPTKELLPSTEGLAEAAKRAAELLAAQ